MIQAPQTQYMPQTNTQVYNQPQGYQIPMQNVPQPQSQGVIYNYPASSSYSPVKGYGADKSQFNGVNIEILNPQGVGGVPQVQNPVQYTMPAQFVPVQQPIVMPQAPTAQPLPMAPADAQQIPAPQIQQAPVVNQEVPPAAAPTVEPQQAPDPSVSPEAFAGKLKTNDLDAQKTAIEDLAKLVKEDETAGPLLLDTQVFDALTDIVNADTSQLEGPSQEVTELRNKPQEQLTEEEKTKALTPSELEKAEMNKQYALYTIAYMQERLNNELEKRNGTALELKDLPCIESVIDAAKSNQNPTVRTGAIAALSYIARPEYAQDLNTIFELAKSDEDERVKQEAENAIQNLPQAAEAQPADAQAADENKPADEAKEADAKETDAKETDAKEADAKSDEKAEDKKAEEKK